MPQRKTSPTSMVSYSYSIRSNTTIAMIMTLLTVSKGSSKEAAPCINVTRTTFITRRGSRTFRGSARMSGLPDLSAVLSQLTFAL
jgi:hypothetical protein